jgi:hypothetical protein
MSHFEYVSVILSLVLGLSLSLLLTSALGVFRLRQVVRLHWIPLLWAFYIFVSQIQIMWAIYGLSTIEFISGFTFLSLLLLAILLFIAGGLILPNNARQMGVSLLEYFQNDGRWGLLAYTIFWFFAFFINLSVFHLTLWDPANITLFILIALALMAFLIPRILVLATILYGIALIINTLMAQFALDKILGW